MFCGKTEHKKMICFLIILSIPQILTQNIPQPDFQIHNLTLGGNLNRFYFTLPKNTFTDVEDGNIDNLKLSFLLLNGNAIPKTNWVQYKEDTKELIGYANEIIYSNQPRFGYEFQMKATDNDGNVGQKIFNFKLESRRTPYYKRQLKLISTNSLVYVRNDVENLFNIQEEKFIPYSLRNQQGVNDVAYLITDSLIITKAGSQTSIDLTWSMSAFLSNACNVEEIVRLRSKTVGIYRNQYEAMFLPLYQFQTVTEVFTGVCSYLSSGSPLIGVISLSTVNVNYGSKFSYLIPTNAFLPPTNGASMPLTLELRSQTGQTLSKVNWLMLSGSSLAQGVRLEGYITYQQASLQTVYQYQLVAKTPLLEEVYRIIDVRVDNVPAIVKNFIISFVSSTVVAASYTQFIQTFLATLASYLSLLPSSVLIYAFSSDQAGTTIQWTLASLSSSADCDDKSVAGLVTQLRGVNGEVKAELQNTFNGIGFNIEDLKIDTGANCYTKPLINKPLGRFVFTWGTFFRYVISTDAYVDGRDGSNLQFSIINNNLFSSSNWLSINSATRTIYGVPIVSTLTKGIKYEFVLRVANSYGLFIEDTFSIQSDMTPPSRSYMYRFRIQYSSTYASLPSVLSAFFNRLYVYFADTNQNQLLINDVVTIPNERRMDIMYYNTSFRVSPCDTQAQIAANMKLFEIKNPNPALIKAMSPDFIITDITSTREESCRSNSFPVINIFGNLSSQLGPHIIKWGTIFQLKLAEKLLRDEEDGYTYDFKDITLKPATSNFELSLSSWIYYDHSSFTVYAVPMDSTYQLLGNNEVLKYILRAVDSGGLAVSTEYIVQPTGSISTLYTITYSMKLFKIAKTSYSYQLITIYQELWQMFGTSYKGNMCIRNYHLTSMSGDDGEATLTWTLCDLPLTGCDFSKINAVRNLLFVDGGSVVKMNIKTAYSNFQITNVIDSGTGSCRLSPPVIVNQIPVLKTTFCGLFTYRIPENTFIDSEDGNTRNLKLSMTDGSGNSLSSSSWLHFDSTSQTIKALLTQSMFTSGQFYNTQTFTLTATDKSMLSIAQTVTFVINGGAFLTDYKIILQVKYEAIDENLNLFIALAEKVGNYVGDAAKGFEAISSSIATDGTNIFEFGNCTIPYSPCNALELANYKNFFKNDDGTWKAAFTLTLKPDFTQQYISESLKGPCANDGPPQLINRWGPLQVTIQRTNTFKVPENMFYDQEQGNTRNLQLETTSISGESLYWVSFNSVLQTLTVIATKDIGISLQPSSALTIRLTAFDINRQSAYQDLKIVISYPPGSASHYISMQMSLRFPVTTYSFVSVYSLLRTSLVQYFGDDVNIDTVSYHSLSNNIQSIVNVVWSNSTISRVLCESEKINYILLRIFVTTTATKTNPLFIAALSTYFNILETNFFYDGICKDERTPPQMDNAVPPLKVTFCNPAEYYIPDNTFSDKIDGNTRNLKLTFTKSNNLPISVDSFVQLDSTTQRIIVSPYSSAFLGVSFPSRLSYQLTATNSRGLFVSTYIYIDVEASQPQYSYYFTMSGIWQGQTEFTLAHIIKEYQSKTSNYLGYSTGNDIFVIEANRPTTSSLAFSIKATSCRLQYDPCERNQIEKLQSELFNTIANTYKTVYASSLLPNIRILSLADEKVGPCKEQNKIPFQNLQIPSATLRSCTAFQYKLPSQTFQDPEDGFDLNYIIIYINGNPVNADNAWIYQTTSKDILAVVDNYVVANSLNNAYQITVRAFDSEQAYVDANWNIFINGTQHQTFYKFQLDLTAKSDLEQKFIERYYLTKFTNDYFGSSFVNAMSLEYFSNRRIYFSWSSCTLPAYCDPNAANIFLMNMKIQDSIVERFRQAFSTRFTLNDVTMIVDDKCKTPLNPPRPKQNTWVINLNQCGGRSEVVPNDMFYDSEDGDTRSLGLSITLADGKTILPWIYLDTDLQTIHVIPTRQEAMNFGGVFKLIATDSTGLSGSVDVSLSIAVPQEPKYIFVLQYSVSTQLQRTLEVKDFSNKLANFLGSSTSSIALQSYSIVSATTRYIKYANCSVSYNPCDISSLKNTRNRLLTSNNFPQSIFSTAMQPSYNLLFGLTEELPPCNGNTPSPPKVITTIETIVIPLCGYFQYLIPENTFYDAQDGNTRQLSLSLTTSNGQTLSSESWINFNTQTQVITAIPTAQNSIASPNGFTFTLTALDSSQLPAQTQFDIKINGPASIANECQIRIDYSTSDVFSNRIDRLKYLISRMKTYFQLSSDQDIVIVNYVKQSSTNFQMYWSYCSPLYREASSSMNQVDYYGFATKILMKLFQSDRQTVQSGFKTLFGSLYEVRSVTTQFTERCKNIPPIVMPGFSEIKITLFTCGYTERSLVNTMFYDFEDGGTESLHLSMYQSNGITQLPIDSWINVDAESQSIIVTCDDSVRKLVPAVYNVILRATDSNGAIVNLQVVLEKFQQPIDQLSPFEITFEMKYNGLTLRPTVYEIKVLMQLITTYYQLPGTSSLLIKAYEITNSYSLNRRVTWTTCELQSCTSAVFSKTKGIFTVTGEIISSFANAFIDNFVMYRAYYKSSCNPPTDSPTPASDPPKPPKIQFCTLFSYQLSNALFYDYGENVDLRRLMVKIGDSNGNDLLKSSFIQLNPATLEIYGINVESMSVGSVIYRISASNSARLTQTMPIAFENTKTPFVANCPVTMTVRHKYQGYNTKDLDVLWTVVKSIQNYYLDLTIMIKVIDFFQKPDGEYYLQWSNCSFSFTSEQEANKGLDENDRVKINSIFSRLIDIQTKQINKNFQSSLSQYFTITSLSVSYKCIETNPYPGDNIELRIYPKPCQFFKQILPNNLFLDDKDGDIRNMKLTLTYTNGQDVISDEWIQVDTRDRNEQYIYATVTSEVQKNTPDGGFKYLIKCSDTSGRIATISLVVYVIKQENIYPNKFIIGFRTIMLQNQPSAFILGELSRLLARYIIPSDSTTQLFISKFNRESFIEFSHCNLACNANTFTDIFTKLQAIRYETNPSFQFVRSLQPNFEVTYSYVSAPTCYPNNNETITTGFCTEINLSACGYYTRTISTICYRDNFYRTAKSFEIDLYKESGEILSLNSWLQFDKATQTYYGVPIWSQLTSKQSFKTTVTHPASGNILITSSVFNIEKYSTINSVKNSICQTKLSFSTVYKDQYSDVTILRKILEKISSFLSPNPGIADYLVLNLTQQNNIYTMTYSNCSWITLVQNGASSNGRYLQEVLNVMQQYFVITGTTIIDVKPSFRQHLKPEFEFYDIQATTACTNTPISPPIPTRDLIITLDKSCGKFTFRIPDDLFTDSKYGNTRKLQLQLLTALNLQLAKTTWINLNSDQYLYGIINKIINQNQPANGYEYLLKATNGDRQSASTRVFVNIPKKVWLDEVITFKIVSSAISDNNYDIDYQTQTLNQIESFSTFAQLPDQFYVKSVDTLNSMSLIDYAYCDQCDQSYYMRIKHSQQNALDLITWIRNVIAVVNIQYQILSINEINSICSSKDNKRTYDVNFELCRDNNYNLSNLYTSYVEQLSSVQLLTITGAQLAQSSWVTVLTKPYRLVAYPTKSLMLLQPDNGYQFLIRLIENGVALNNGQQINVKISEKSPIDAQMYTLTIIDNNKNTNPDNYYISDIWQITSTYLGGTNYLQHNSITRITLLPLLFTISWYNCSLKCGDTQIQTVNNKLFTNGLVSDSYKQSFPSNYKVESLDTSCKNNPPIVQKTLTLNITACGYFAYKLPNNFAYDSTDGYLENLSAEMKNIDGTDLTVKSWIQFDKNRKEIVALTTEAIKNSVPSNGYRFTLFVTDSTQKTSTSLIIVNINDQGDGNMKFEIEFKSTYSPSLTYLELQKRLISIIGSYINNNQLSDFQTLTFQNNIDNVFYYKLGYCKIEEYVCPTESIKLTTLVSTINQNGITNPLFTEYIRQASQNSITITYTGIEVFYKVIDAPISNSAAATFTATYCNNERFDISNTVFKNNNKDAVLTYKLTFENGNEIPLNNWVYLYDRYIYVMPFATSSSGSSIYKLTATDKCDQSVVNDINIELTGQPVTASYSILLRFQPQSIIKPYALEIWTIQQKIKECYNKQIETIRTESFVFLNNLMEYRWSSCTLKTSPCDNRMIDLLYTKTFSAPNIVSQSIRSCFLPEYILFDASENRLQDCTPPPNPPRVSNLPSKIFTEFCQKLSYQLPVNIFIDVEDGNTRNLKLQLLTEDLNPLPKTEWIQFDAGRQTIYGYPRTGLDTGNIRRTYIYKLKAIDSSAAYTITDVLIELRGAVPSLDYYMCLYATQSNTNKPNIDEELLLISSLQGYFNKGNLNDISFTRTDDNNIVFKYSFCETPSEVCTCSQLKQFRDMIYFSSFNHLRNYLQPNVTITKVTDERQGKCLLNKNPVIDKGIPINNIFIGECYSYSIPENAFYDEEDGNTKNLDLTLTTITKVDWMRLNENQHICGILSYREFERLNWAKDENTMYQYNISAYDSCMNIATLVTKSTINAKRYITKRYYLLYMVLRLNEEKLMSNCTHIDVLFTKIAGFTNHSKTDIFVEDIYVYNNTLSNYTEIVWGYEEYSYNCSNNTNVIAKKYFVNSIEENPEFIEYMKPQFDVEKVREEKSKDCIKVPPTVVFFANPDDFPWWVLWVLLALALLVLLLWILWLCCPKCCPTLCGNCCGRSCRKCCEPETKYAEFEESSEHSPSVRPKSGKDGAAPKPRDQIDAPKPLSNPNGNSDPYGGVLSLPRDEIDAPKSLSNPNGNNDPYGGVLSLPRDETDSPEELIPNTNTAGVMLEEVPNSLDDTYEEQEDAPIRGGVLSKPLEEDQRYPQKLKGHRLAPVSESSVHVSERKDVEHEVDFKFLDSEKSSSKVSFQRLPSIDQLGDTMPRLLPLQNIKTESYTDKRILQKTMYNRSRNDHQEQREIKTENRRDPRSHLFSKESNVFVERFADRRPKNIVIGDSSDDEIDQSVIAEKKKRSKPFIIEEKRTKPIVVETRRESKPIRNYRNHYRRSQSYRYVDALVDTPIVIEVKDRKPRRRHRSHHGSDGDTLILRRSRNDYTTKRKRSVSPLIHRLQSIRRKSMSPTRRRSISPFRLHKRSTTLHIGPETEKKYLYSRARFDPNEKRSEPRFESRHRKSRLRSSVDHRDLTLYIDSDDSFNNNIVINTKDRQSIPSSERRHRESDLSKKEFLTSNMNRTGHSAVPIYSQKRAKSREASRERISRSTVGKSQPLYNLESVNMKRGRSTRKYFDSDYDMDSEV